jgi:dihydrofolate reductase
VRKIVANLFISLDGVVESPQEWHFPYMNDEMGQVIGGGFATSDALLMGRATYQEWVGHWPTANGPMADQINSLAKYVVSSSLDAVEWQNTTLISDDVEAQLTALKQQEGKDIAMSGSSVLVEWLLEHGLLDELRLMLHPVVVGHGRRLFSDGPASASLELVRSNAFTTGVLDLTYRPAGA